MNKINIHNYEAYLLDFSEGNLPEELNMELQVFLIQNPQLNINLSELIFDPIDCEDSFFINKKNLKKSPADLVSEEQFISYIEHQLTYKECLSIEKSCTNNPEIKKELNLYQKTILVPDKGITYSDKEELKRKPKYIWFNFTVSQYSIAAAIALLFGIFLFWQQGFIKDKKYVVDTNKKNTMPNISAHSQVNSLAQPIITVNKVGGNKNRISSGRKIKNVTINKAYSSNTLSNEITLQADTQTIHDNEINKEPLANTEPKAKIIKEVMPPTFIATIIESEENDQTIKNTKSGFWKLATKTLKKLNVMGIKSLDGREEIENNNAAYALTFGGFNIVHKTKEPNL